GNGGRSPTTPPPPATRNLFIGNLDHNVSEVELRRAFEKYGIIEEVVIKRPARGQGGAYAFLKFQNLDMAHRAKVAMSGRVVDPSLLHLLRLFRCVLQGGRGKRGSFFVLYERLKGWFCIFFSFFFLSCLLLIS
uniref:RRM domain-containing protein n=1 Tax=Accipiter nisus TaxID=211598 RepID=A0A8B9MF96_9AVES